MMTLDVIEPNDPNYHKPIEELIEDLGHAEPANQYGDAIITVEDLTDALHYLQTYQRIEDEYEELKDWWAEEYVTNEPLSWEELKQMTGKPVWVELQKCGNHWLIITDIKSNGAVGRGVYGENVPLYKDRIGIDWQAYRKERQNVQS